MTHSFNAVHQGDCIEHLAAIEPGSVDLVFADPPFNIGYEYDQYDDRRSGEEYLDWSRQWIAGVARVLKPDGTFWLAIGDEYAAELKLIAQNDAGFSCRSWVIWYYTFGVNCVRGFSRSHTHLFHFAKDPSRFTFNADNPQVRVPSARQLVYQDARANPKGRLPDNTWIYRPQDAPASGFAPMHDTWYFARVAGTFKEREGFHGCQMPEQLLGRIIRVSSNPQDLVLDPFAGSGTTLVVAKKLGRRWLGLELSKDYVAHIKRRLKEAAIGDPLDGPADPVRSAPATAKGKRKGRMRGGKILPELDPETERGLIAAYRATCKNKSTDHLLCDPELNAAFVATCRKKGVRGDAYLWNRLLLRIRKAGKLPRLDPARHRLSFEQMDEYSFASEIATQLVTTNHDCTLDEMLCSPAAAAEFDELAARFAPGFSPFEYRWAALTIRKRAPGWKATARQQHPEWLERELPRPVPLSKGVSSKHEQPGIYVLINGQQPLYVGHTRNLRHRIEQTAENAAWQEFTPRKVRFLPNNGEAVKPNALRPVLIHREQPLLNWRYLAAEPQ